MTTKTTNKGTNLNGGKTMKKQGTRVWQFAKSMGIKKHHHFCFITQAEFMTAMSAVNNSTINVQDNKQEQINQGGNTMTNTKRYFIHTQRKDNHVNNNAMPYYDDMAEMCGMKDKKIYFGFGEARVSDDVSYFDACAQAYNACREGGVVYLFEYDAPAYGDINVHDFDYWMEYLSEVQSMFCNQETTKSWYDAIANNETMVNNDEYNFAGCINEVVFHKDSSVRLVAKIDCATEQQCRFIYNYFADEYNMTISHDGNKNSNHATISDFTFDEWKQMVKFVTTNGNGVVISKKSGLAIERSQIQQIKDWVRKRL